MKRGRHVSFTLSPVETERNRGRHVRYTLPPFETERNGAAWGYTLPPIKTERNGGSVNLTCCPPVHSKQKEKTQGQQALPV